MKAADLAKQMFKEKAKWIILQEDKVIDALDDGQFPGSILLKIEFGDTADFQAAEKEWSNASYRMAVQRSFLVRVNVFQCKDLPASDSNGLCDPFLKIKFMGQKQETKV